MKSTTRSNSKLGWELHEHLVSRGLETPLDVDNLKISDEEKKSKIEYHVAQILKTLGLDLTDDSLEETPFRIAKMYVNELMGGLNYDHFPKCTAVENKFHQHVEEGQIKPFVMLSSLTVNSLCEHHALPIMGKAAISYIPQKKVLGLSKFQRIVDFFSSRPQVQERLTEQIAEAIAFITESPDVAVFMDCEHLCMKVRGVESPCASTVTLATRGAFAAEHSPIRQEFLALVRSSKIVL